MHPTVKNQSAKKKTAWAAELHEVSIKAQCRLDIKFTKKSYQPRKEENM